LTNDVPSFLKSIVPCAKLLSAVMAASMVKHVFLIREFPFHGRPRYQTAKPKAATAAGAFVVNRCERIKLLSEQAVNRKKPSPGFRFARARH
jgi:hypothetical protein